MRSIGVLSPIATVCGYDLEVLRTWSSNKLRGGPELSTACERHSSAQPRLANSLDFALQTSAEYHISRSTALLLEYAIIYKLVSFLQSLAILEHYRY